MSLIGCFSCQFKYTLMHQFKREGASSLEDHLTNSIRRAKEKIFSNTSNQSQLEDTKIQQSQPIKAPYFESRNRTQSHKNIMGNSNRDDKNTLAAAMKTLQDRIAVLQREKRQILSKERSTQNQAKIAKLQKSEREQRQLSKLVSTLKDKQHEIKKLSRVNSDLSFKNADLMNRVQEMEDQLFKCKSRQNIELSSPINIKQDAIQQKIVMDRPLKIDPLIISAKDAKIKELQDKIAQLELRNSVNHQTIQKIMRQLEQQKKINLRWIKLQESQFNEAEQKENCSLEANKQPSKIKNNKQPSELKRQNTILLRNNKEMFETMQRNKIRINQLSRQCKQYEQKYNKLKLIAMQIVDNVNKVIPNPNSHIRFLTLKITKMENSYLQGLRSYSGHSRKSRNIDRSDSKDRKKSLKMSDLASSEKKSNERSGTKSNKKKKLDDSHLAKSQKKKKKYSEEEIQLQTLEKEIGALKKIFRNLVARVGKDKSKDEQINKKIEQTTEEFNKKNDRIKELRTNNNSMPKDQKSSLLKL